MTWFLHVYYILQYMIYSFRNASSQPAGVSSSSSAWNIKNQKKNFLSLTSVPQDLWTWQEHYSCTRTSLIERNRSSSPVPGRWADPIFVHCNVSYSERSLDPCRKNVTFIGTTWCMQVSHAAGSHNCRMLNLKPEPAEVSCRSQLLCSCDLRVCKQYTLHK